MERLVPFYRLSPAIQRECRGILDSFYTDLCEDYLFAVLDSTSNVIAILQYDKGYQKANVLWGNWMVACRALAHCCQPGALHVFWEKHKKRIVDIIESEADSDFDRAEEAEEECDVVTDIPDAAMGSVLPILISSRATAWTVATAWVSIHPGCQTQAVLFRSEAIQSLATISDKGAQVLLNRINIQACLKMGWNPDSTWEWQTCDVTLKQMGTKLHLAFHTPLVCWFSRNDDDVCLHVRGWTEHLRACPRTNKFRWYYDDDDDDDDNDVSYYDITRSNFRNYFTAGPIRNGAFVCVCGIIVDGRPEKIKNEPYYTERQELRDALVGLAFQHHHSARLIQRAWRRCIGNPGFAVCKRRLLSEFRAM